MASTAFERMVVESKRRFRFAGNATERICAVVVAAFVLIYTISYSTLSIARYWTGQTLFDLATFEQGFWNATQGTLFFYSLEGELSRFGRHFSPIFFLLLPAYALHRSPSTLLTLQSFALGVAAIPLYLIARRRLHNSPAAVIVAALYLAGPAVHDINTVNDFHEIAFAVPLLFLAFYAADTRRWWLYAVAVFGALAVKEDVALVVAALGIYVFLAMRERRAGLLTFVGSVAWFVVVVQIVMPALRGPNGPVPFPGYDYLGQGILGITRGILTKPVTLWHVVIADAKQRYLFWLLTPVGFAALLAPEVLLIAAPGLLLILASTFPPTYVIFERYVAPVLPFVYIAAVVGLERMARIVPRPGQRAVVVITAVVLFIGGGTGYAQYRLQKFPHQLLTSMTPDPHVALGHAILQEIPSARSVVIEDHRFLAHAANRRHLYFLSSTSPFPDYLFIDKSAAPITNVAPAERQAAIARISADPDYVTLACQGDFVLYARAVAYQHDHDRFAPYCAVSTNG